MRNMPGYLSLMVRYHSLRWHYPNQVAGRSDLASSQPTDGQLPGLDDEIFIFPFGLFAVKAVGYAGYSC